MPEKARQEQILHFLPEIMTPSVKPTQRFLHPVTLITQHAEDL